MAGQFPSQEPDEEFNEEPAPKGGWRRPLSYLLLIAGAAGILFNNNISQATGLPVTALQVATFILFIGGAALFFSVRETADRVSSYREVFTATDKPSDLPPKDPKPTASSDEQPQ